MADQRTKVIIDGDTSGAVSAAKRADSAMINLGKTLNDQNSNVKKYGGTISKVFGADGVLQIKHWGEQATHSTQKFQNNVRGLSKSVSSGSGGLRRNINDLEMPLRDVEGSFDRVAMATRVWGNAAETASEKATVGFLLAADSIATFASGGVAGIAVAAAVAGFSMLAKVIDDEAEAAREAEAVTKKQAEALKALADAALSAGVSIAAQKSLEAVTKQSRGLLEVEDKLNTNRAEQVRLLRELGREDLAVAKAHEARLLFNEEEVVQLTTIPRLREKASERLVALRAEETKLAKSQVEAQEAVGRAANKAADDRERYSGSATQAIIEHANKVAGAVVVAVDKVKESSKANTDDFTAVANERLKNLEVERQVDLQVRADNKKADRQEAKADAAYDLEQQRKHQQQKFDLWAMDARVEAEAKEELRKASDKSSQEQAQNIEKAYNAAASAVTSQLFSMAVAGEFSFAKIAEAATLAAGQTLVADGTTTFMKGVAKMFNPLSAPIGIAEAKQGSLMVATGLAMGAIGGAISGAGAPAAAPSARSAPTDTRQSRAASSSGDAGGGATIINFNGPAYDRRGVANILSSGQKMARHRRIAGA